MWWDLNPWPPLGALTTELHNHFRITRNMVLFSTNNLVSTTWVRNIPTSITTKTPNPIFFLSPFRERAFTCESGPRWDSNPRLSDCQSDALANWATGPWKLSCLRSNSRLTTGAIVIDSTIRFYMTSENVSGESGTRTHDYGRDRTLKTLLYDSFSRILYLRVLPTELSLRFELFKVQPKRLGLAGLNPTSSSTIRFYPTSENVNKNP